MLTSLSRIAIWPRKYRMEVDRMVLTLMKRLMHM